jgi:hypothetical protein
MAGEIIRARDAQNLPAHLEDAAQTGVALDLPAYAAALQKARAELAEAQRENRRLAKIAATIQGSGWVRFGAWVGDRSARRMMEMDEEQSPETTSPPTSTPRVRPADIKPSA